METACTISVIYFHISDPTQLGDNAKDNGFTPHGPHQPRLSIKFNLQGHGRGRGGDRLPVFIKFHAIGDLSRIELGDAMAWYNSIDNNDVMTPPDYPVWGTGTQIFRWSLW